MLIFSSYSFTLQQNKRAKKTDVLVLSETKHAFFTSLLEVVIKKMEWDRDAEWSLGEEDGDVDPDEVAMFQTMRKVRPRLVLRVRRVSKLTFFCLVLP